MTTNNVLQNPPSDEDQMAKWGLTSNNMKLIRHELKTLLLEYLKNGDALVDMS